MNQTTDCPICLCPIPSEPWGVVSPCGHPYHRECWDQVVANHHAKPGGGNKKKLACSICKGASRGFVPVFLDLGNDDNDNITGGGGGAVCRIVGKSTGDDGAVDIDDGDIEKLVNEWDGLWNELETLCCCGEQRGGSENDDDHDVVLRADRSDRDVANICVAIDLTQPSSPPQEKEQTKLSSSAISLQNQMQQIHQQSRIKSILHRLKVIHTKIMNSQQSISSSTSNGRQIERLRSKVKSLLATNAELTSQTESLQTINDDTSNELDNMKRIVSGRTVELERKTQQYNKLSSQFNAMEGSYQKYMAQSSLQKKSLHEKIDKLQTEYAKLSNQAGLEDMQEMEVIRHKYTKMSQEVHDVKTKNSKLEKELRRKERDFELVYNKEKNECDKLRRQIQILLKGGSDISSNNARESSSSSSSTNINASNGRMNKSRMNTQESDNERIRRNHTASESFNTASKAMANLQRVDDTTESHQSSSLSIKMKIGSGNAQKRSNLMTTKRGISGTSLLPSSSNISGNTKQTSSKAMDALDKTTSKRKFKRPHQQTDLAWLSNSPSGSTKNIEGALADNNGIDRGVGVVMMTGNSHPSKKRRHQSSTTAALESVSTKSSRKRTTATHPSREKGNIASFFKPVVNVDEVDC